jgi:putative DNA primase/helicase
MAETIEGARDVLVESGTVAGEASPGGFPGRAEDPVALRVEEVRGGITRGWAFTPLNGKAPTLKGWPNGPKVTLEEVLAWARAGNIGLLTGARSGVVVIDFDGDARPDERFPETVAVETGGGGLHLYYRMPAGAAIPNSVKKLGPSIDVRGDGGQVVFVGSIHPKTKRIYRWAPGRSPAEMDMAPLPAWILEAIARRNSPASPPVDGRGTAYGVAALEDELRSLRSVAKGQRNDQLNRSAFAIAQLAAAGELDLGAAQAALVQAATPWIDDDCTADEIRLTIDSGWRAGTEHPRGPAIPSGNGSKPPIGAVLTPHHTTDVGNGARLVARHGRDLRFSHPWKTWLVWDGSRWTEDKTGEVMRRAKDTVASIYAEAAQAPNEEARKALASWAGRSESVQRLKAMIESAQSEAGVAVLPENLDADPWLLNVENGTLDLRTAELRERRREDLITKLVPVSYDPDAQCPRWLAFLGEIMAGKQALVAYLQRVLGYCLTGRTSEQCFWILHGTGANGKSVLVNTMRALSGDYAEQTPATTFMARRDQAGTNDLAKLRGARFVSAIESEDGQRLAEGLVKQLTGEDALTVRFLFQEFFTFKPAFKVVLATNHRPTIRGTDPAIWRRVRLVPFSVTIPADQQDRELGTKLLEELPGILAWAVEGCQQWLEDGSLRDPPEVLAATADYRAEQDRLADFIAECCVEGPGQTAPAGELYSAYREWSERAGEKPASQKWFGQRLKERGHNNDARLPSGRKAWRGVGLRAFGGGER